MDNDIDQSTDPKQNYYNAQLQLLRKLSDNITEQYNSIPIEYQSDLQNKSTIMTNLLTQLITCTLAEEDGCNFVVFSLKVFYESVVPQFISTTITEEDKEKFEWNLHSMKLPSIGTNDDICVHVIRHANMFNNYNTQLSNKLIESNVATCHSISIDQFHMLDEIRLTPHIVVCSDKYFLYKRRGGYTNIAYIKIYKMLYNRLHDHLDEHMLTYFQNLYDGYNVQPTEKYINFVYTNTKHHEKYYDVEILLNALLYSCYLRNPSYAHSCIFKTYIDNLSNVNLYRDDV